MKQPAEVELAQQLIGMRSTPESGGQLRVAEFLADRLARSGFNVSTQAYGDHHSNVVARWGREDQAAICLTGHLDTVTVVEDDWQHDPFAGEIVDSRLYGRGAVDMKTGVAAMVVAAEEYAATAPDDATPIVLVLTAEEEVGCLGAVALVEQGMLPDSSVLLVAEPTSNQPVLGHRGALWVDLVATGVSCHASTPHLGVNAIDRLTDGLRAVRNWCDANPTAHEILGPRTLNVGRVDGGVLRNVVPARAVAELDFRTAFESEQAELPSTLGSLVGPDIDVRLVQSLPPVYSEPEERTVARVREVVGQFVEVSSEPSVARFFTDASVLTPALGSVPTVICGPGSPDLAHVVDEWCAVEEIMVAMQIYRELLQRLGWRG